MSGPLSLHQIKVLVLYTVDGTPGPVPRHVIETALALCDANIFGIQEALHDLIANENLTQKNDENEIPYLFLTPQGKTVVEPLRKDVPLSYREKALAYAAAEMSKLRTEIGVEAVVAPIEKGNGVEYACNINLSDEGITMMGLTLYSPNKLQAEMMAERFRKNPLDIYRKVLHIMTGTDTENNTEE
ncbi:MAG: DUF4364 family protein [Clostridia bacterium]|nr:DUF4364 family protein [Clostridia bacterium]